MNESDLLPSIQRQILIPHTDAVPRSGEGTAVLRRDGSILLVHTRFVEGGADHDPAELVGGTLDLDAGVLREERVFFPDENAVNQMCAGLERLADGDLGMIFVRRTARDEDDIFFSRSRDEGETWSTPVKVNACCDEKFIVVNNDRLRQFTTGRIAIPVALYPDRSDRSRPCTLAMFYSDDGGVTWAISQRIKILEKNIAPPHALHAGAEQVWKDGCEYYAKEQEPGVEELADGRLLMYCRTYIAYMYQAYSDDGGESWSELRAATQIVSPCSPQSIRRVPGRRRLVCVFNHRRHIAYGDTGRFWSWRTPLTLAISDDDAASWTILGNIEDESHNYCYVSMLFLGERLLLTYYASRNLIEDGKPVRRDLSSLKMQVLDIGAF